MKHTGRPSRVVSLDISARGGWLRWLRRASPRILSSVSRPRLWIISFSCCNSLLISFIPPEFSPGGSLNAATTGFEAVDLWENFSNKVSTHAGGFSEFTGTELGTLSESAATGMVFCSLVIITPSLLAKSYLPIMATLSLIIETDWFHARSRAIYYQEYSSGKFCDPFLFGAVIWHEPPSSMGLPRRCAHIATRVSLTMGWHWMVLAFPRNTPYRSFLGFSRKQSWMN